MSRKIEFQNYSRIKDSGLTKHMVGPQDLVVASIAMGISTSSLYLSIT